MEAADDLLNESQQSASQGIVDRASARFSKLKKARGAISATSAAASTVQEKISAQEKMGAMEVIHRHLPDVLAVEPVKLVSISVYIKCNYCDVNDMFLN